MKSIQTGNSHQKFSKRRIEDNTKLLAHRNFVKIKLDTKHQYSRLSKI